jgi:hypothetical protein
MASPAEKVERAISLLMRVIVAAVLPLWALAMIAVGVGHGSAWWIIAGLVVAAVGVLMLAGSPLADLILRDR